MKLSKETIADIAAMAEHRRYGTDDTSRNYEMDSLIDLTTDLPRRFTIEIRRVELVPDTIDYIVNVMALRIIEMYDTDYDEGERIDAENALWDYLKRVYNFDTEDARYESYLLKATFEEALSYAIQKIGIQA